MNIRMDKDDWKAFRKGFVTALSMICGMIGIVLAACLLIYFLTFAPHPELFIIAFVLCAISIAVGCLFVADDRSERRVAKRETERYRIK